MATLSLIKELKARKQEIYDELRNQFPDMMEELDAIDKILDRGRQRMSSNGEESKDKVLKGTPKGDMSWEDYVYFMLKEIGGVGKSLDVAKAIVAANDDITLKRAKDACSDKLSKHLQARRIKATKPKSKKDGYLYEIEG